MKKFLRFFTTDISLNKIQDNVEKVFDSLKQTKIINNKIINVTLEKDIEYIVNENVEGYLVISNNEYCNIKTISLSPLTIVSNEMCIIKLMIF
jgi:hypothetical protein